jgi:hypothetical protein
MDTRHGVAEPDVRGEMMRQNVVLKAFSVPSVRSVVVRLSIMGLRQPVVGGSGDAGRTATS